MQKMEKGFPREQQGNCCSKGTACANATGHTCIWHVGKIESLGVESVAWGEAGRGGTKQETDGVTGQTPSASLSE